MNKIIDFLQLNSLKGLRTKIFVAIGFIVWYAAKLGYMDQNLATLLEPLIIWLAVHFGLEHFEPPVAK